MISDFPEHLFKPWCILYRRIAVDYEARLTNLLQQSKYSEIQRALSEAGKALPTLLTELEANIDNLSRSDLLSVYACLKEIENLYRSTPWQHRRGGMVPEIGINGHRYFLRSPPSGYIVAAVPANERFTAAEDIGRNRVLGFRYRWTEISTETQLDWDYSPILDGLLAKKQLRVGFSPIAGVSEMRWYSDCQDRRGFRGEVPIRCLDVQDEAIIWERMENVLQDAYDAGVHLLLFPELILTESLLTKISNWLETHNLESPVIRLVVAGTRHVDTDENPGEFCNRCTVLDSAGHVAWEQDKRQYFTLEAAELIDLLPGFDAPAAFEPTHVSSALAVRETAIGRILTSICLDYINEEVWAKLAGDLHLVPVMSPGLSRFRDRVRFLGNLSGSTSLICNACPNGDPKNRVLAYIPSKRAPEITSKGINLFTLDISFFMN